MNRFIALMLFLILLQLPLLLYQIHLEDEADDLSGDDPFAAAPPQPQSFGPSVSLIEQNSHGGSWLDSFEDNSGIDTAASSHLNVTGGDAFILKESPQPFTVDNHTAALWHFNESSGTSVGDSSPNKNHGTFKKSPTWATGRFANGLSLSGGGQWTIGDHVVVPHSNSLDITGNFTIEAWIKASGTQNYYCIVDKYKHDRATNYEYGYTFYLTGGKIRLSIYSGSNGPGNIVGTSDLRDNKWHYVACVFNGTYQSLYVDCNLEASSARKYAPASTTNNLGIGLRLSGHGGYLPFTGVIDEVRISNEARSFEDFAYMQSKPISLPSNMKWNTLIVNRTTPDQTSLNIKILNASDNQPILSSPTYTADGEFDISSIDPVKYPSIKLNASFCSEMCSKTPTLHYWGVSWRAENAWRDTFFGGEFTNGVSSLFVNDGDIQCPPPYQVNGYLRSSAIEVPVGYHFDTMIINKTVPNGTTHNITIFDAVSNNTISGFVGLDGSNIDLSPIDTSNHSKIWLLAIFAPYGNLTPVLYDWSLSWAVNQTIPNGSKFIDLDPDTLNLKSQGRWITCYIEPQDGSDPSNINISTILLNATIPAELHPTEVGDYDNDSLPDLMVKFNRSAVQQLVTVSENVTLYVSGYYNDSTYFIGSDTIRVINPPKK